MKKIRNIVFVAIILICLLGNTVLAASENIISQDNMTNTEQNNDSNNEKNDNNNKENGTTTNNSNEEQKNSNTDNVMEEEIMPQEDSNQQKTLQNDNDNSKNEENNDNASTKKQVKETARVTSQKTIENGVYEIGSAINSNMLFDVKDGSTNEGTQIQLWEKDGFIQQRYEIVYGSDGYYTIKSMLSGKLLCAETSNIVNNTNLVQKSKSGSDAEKWIIKSEGNNRYSIISKINNNFYIDVPGANASNSQTLGLYESNGSDAQRFYFNQLIGTSKQYIKDGTYEIVTVIDPNLAFDMTDGSEKDGTRVQLWQQDDFLQQRYELKYGTDGYYTITAKRSGKVLSTENTLDNASKLIQKTETGADTEKWVIRAEGNNEYSIISKYNGLAMNIPGGNAVNGEKLDMYIPNSSSTQKFKFNDKTPIQGTKTIENGNYTILSCINTTQAFDMTDGSTKDGAQVQLWQQDGFLQQEFEAIYQNDGYYVIKSRNSGKVLSIEDTYAGNGTKIIQQAETDSDTEKWIIKDEGYNQYSIISKCNNYYITVPNGNPSNGTKLQMYDPINSNSQKFKFVIAGSEVPSQSIKDGVYEITTAINANQSFDVTDGSKEDGAQIQIWEVDGFVQQRFELVYGNDGYYTIKARNSNKVLSVENENPASGSKVIQKTGTGADTEKWIIKSEGNNKYSIISKCKNFYITIPNSNASNGTKLQVHPKLNNDSQRFYFTDRTPMQGKRTVEDGIYTILSSADSILAFDITSGSTSDGARLQLWQQDGFLQQSFQVQYNEDGYYTIKSQLSGKVLSVNSENVKNGTPIIQTTATGSDKEKWIIEDKGNGEYSIISKCNNYYVDIPGGTTVNGIKMQMYQGNGTKYQKYMFKKIGGSQTIKDGTYRIASAINEKYSLDIDGASRNNGANVQIWEWFDDNIQKEFNIKYDGNGCYVISSVNSGKVVDVSNAGTTSGTNVWQYEFNNTDAQKWIIQDNGDGTYSFRSKHNGLYLDIDSGKAENGSNVQVYTGNGSMAQKFKLIEQSAKADKYVDNGKYKIVTKSNQDIGFDVVDGRTENGTEIQLWGYHGVLQEIFDLSYENGYYYIIPGHAENKVLEAQNNKLVINDKNTSNQNQRWFLNPDDNGAYNIVNKGTGLYLDVENGNIANGTRIKLVAQSGKTSQLFVFGDMGVYIDDNKYPGYRQLLNNIKAIHPTWNIEFLYTGLTFDEAVNGEYADKSVNLVDIGTYQGAWIAPNPEGSGSWYSASREGIAYFMDPRNFLNDIDLFQFLDANKYASGSVTLDGIRKEISGSFLQGFEVDINNACMSQGVDPYFVLARLFQEQGRQGSEIGKGQLGPDGKMYYNPYNIGAQLGNEYQTALETAMKNGWDTMQKALEAGIVFLKQDYLEDYQNTLYLNKFNVDKRSSNDLYRHQYMQNLSAPYTEGRTLRNIYKNSNTIESDFTFVIPVYENMPAQNSPRPSNEGGVTADMGPKNVKVVNVNDVPLKLRSEPVIRDDNIIGEFWNDTVLLSVERANGWHRVVTNDGKVGYSSDAYLQVINDVVNCNDRVRVTDDDVRLRAGPGMRFDILINAVDQSLTGTRFNTGTYYIDGHWWDEVLFDDGSKGFVAAEYLYEV